MRILHTADWHLDLSNLDYTVPAVEALIQVAQERRPDLIVHAGDIAVHRGSIHPHVARVLRVLLTRLAATAAGGMLLVEGNHDQVYTAGRDGAARGILAGEDADQSVDGRIRIVTRPEIVEYDDPRGGTASFVCVPSPNKYWLDTARANGAEEADVAGLLGSIVRGLIAQAGPGCIGVFHGSIAGGKTGDEFSMRAGMEGVLPASAWDGCGLVLCGHLHHAQHLGHINSTIFRYPGSIAPLTWNDAKLEPRAYTFDTADFLICDQVLLPVVSQMLEANVDLVAGDGAVPVREQLEAVMHSTWGSVGGARIRLHVRASGALLDTFVAAAMEQDLAAATGARSVTLVAERTDEARVRFDLDAEWGPLQAFDRYLDLKGVTDEAERRALQVIAAGVEQQVADAHLDARYEMRPAWLLAENWCQYASAIVMFGGLGQVVAVTGANYAGKSNLMRAILFALYKHQVSGNLLSDLIRKGQDRACVALEFESGGNRYQVIRELKRGSDGRKCTASLAFLRQGSAVGVPREWVPVNEGKANETQAAIERLVGPLDLFLATSFAGQNDVDALLDLTPAEMKDVLLSVLQRDFEGRSKQLRDRIRIHEQNVEQIRTQHGVYAAQGRPAQELREQLGRIIDMIADWQLQRAAAEDPDTYLEEVGRAQARVAALEEASAQRTRLADEVEKLTLRIATLRQRADQAAACGQRAEKLRAELGAIDLAGEDVEEQLRAARGNYDEALARSQADEGAARARADEAQRVAAQASQAADQAKAASRSAQAELDRAIRSAGLLRQVPCEGATWGDPPGVDMGSCPLLKDAIAARDAVERLTTSYDLANADLDREALRRDEADTAYALAMAELADVQSSGKQAAATARGRVTELEQGLALRRQVERRAAQLQQDLAAAEAGAGRLEDLRAELREAACRHADLTEQLASMTNGEALAAAREELAAADGKRRAAVYRIQQIEKSLAGEQQLLAKVEERCRAASEAAAHAEKLLGELAEQEVILQRLAFVEAAMHRDGIPFLLLEQFAVPQLRGLVNRYLAQTDIRVTVQTERELLGGDLRNAVELTFTDHRGEHPLSAASGFQRTAIGMALRNALADLHAAGTGSRIWLTVQDEGFGTMDQEHLDGAKTTIRAIAEHRGGHFVFVSHVPGMAEIADSVLAVRDQGGVSVVEVQ